MFNPEPNQRLLSKQQIFYVVQRGDTLSQIGERLGMPWRRLAAANGLQRNPHLIFPGQLIALPFLFKSEQPY
jgi:nucleoid-associated protein YgaU